jgi:hypothetical protein
MMNQCCSGIPSPLKDSSYYEITIGIEIFIGLGDHDMYAAIDAVIRREIARATKSVMHKFVMKATARRIATVLAASIEPRQELSSSNQILSLKPMSVDAVMQMDLPCFLLFLPIRQQKISMSFIARWNYI